MTVNDGKGSVVAYFETLAQHMPIGTSDNHKIFSQYGRSPGRDSKSRAPKYEAGMLTNTTQCSVSFSCVQQFCSSWTIWTLWNRNC